MKIIEITYRYDGTDATIRPRPADAEAARMRLDDGSRSISTLLDSLTDGTGVAHRVIPVDPRDLGLATNSPGAPKQRPYAAVLGCSDARVPIELIFNEGPNDLFVVRVAGNGLGLEVLGSLKYAVDHLGGSLKIIVVLGHSGCGAVSAAVDAFLSPRTYLSFAAQHSLRSILDRLLVVVNAAAMAMIAAFGAAPMTGSGSFLRVTYTMTSQVDGVPFTVAAQANEGRIRLVWSPGLPPGGAPRQIIKVTE